MDRISFILSKEKVLQESRFFLPKFQKPVPTNPVLAGVIASRSSGGVLLFFAGRKASKVKFSLYILCVFRISKRKFMKTFYRFCSRFTSNHQQAQNTKFPNRHGSLPIYQNMFFPYSRCKTNKHRTQFIDTRQGEPHS